MLAHRRKFVAGVLLCLIAVVPLSARSPDTLVADEQSGEASQKDLDQNVVTISLQQMQELEQWTRDFLEWQKAVDRWLSLSLQGSWSYFLQQHEKPEPPVWLKGACTLLADDRQFSQPCEMLDRWGEDPFTVRARKATAAAVSGKEAPTNSMWWRHVHLDGLWSTTQSNVNAFGLFGMHVTISVEGRMQVFVAPGIILMNVPTIYGSREVKAATDWGVTYRLFNAGRSTVHFNLVHAWMLGHGQNLANPQMTLAGFSLSFQPRRRP